MGVRVDAKGDDMDMSEMAFGMVDTDKNDKLTKREVRAFLDGMGGMFLGEGLTGKSKEEKKQLINEVFQKLDTDGDKKINKVEAKAGEGFVKEMMEKLKGPGGD